MKKHLKSAICIVLLLCLVAAFAACEKEGGTSSSESSGTASGGTASGSADPTDEYLGEDGHYTPKIGVLDAYKGRTFTILCVGDTGTYQSDDFTTEVGESGIDYGTNYYDAVKSRNDLVEQNYGVTLDIRKEAKATSIATQEATAGTNTYNAFSLGTGDLTTLASDGLLTDLRQLENLDLDAPWWSADANEAFAIGDKLFFTTGDYTIMNKANTWCVIFNKQMIEDNGLENPYDMVNDGTWTFDKMVEMSQAVSNATATSEWNDSNVIYGMVTATVDMRPFYSSSGMLFCEKDEANDPVLQFGTDEASITLAQKILETFNDADWKLYATDITNPVTDIWEDSFGVFYNGRALFRPSGFTAVAKMRSRSEIEFGIVPMPKMLDTQDEYVTVPNNGYSIGIPKQSDDDMEFSAYMVDALAAGAKYDRSGGMTYEYLETTLKGRSYMDEESREMVDYIFSHLRYDVGCVYGFDGLTALMQNLATEKSSDVRSAFDEIADKVQIAIDKVIADYEANT